LRILTFFLCLILIILTERMTVYFGFVFGKCAWLKKYNKEPFSIYIYVHNKLSQFFIFRPRKKGTQEIRLCIKEKPKPYVQITQSAFHFKAINYMIIR